MTKYVCIDIDKLAALHPLCLTIYVRRKRFGQFIVNTSNKEVKILFILQTLVHEWLTTGTAQRSSANNIIPQGKPDIISILDSRFDLNSSSRHFEWTETLAIIL